MVGTTRQPLRVASLISNPVVNTAIVNTAIVNTAIVNAW